jgi:hypothetical protein
MLRVKTERFGGRRRDLRESEGKPRGFAGV